MPPPNGGGGAFEAGGGGTGAEPGGGGAAPAGGGGIPAFGLGTEREAEVPRGVLAVLVDPDLGFCVDRDLEEDDLLLFDPDLSFLTFLGLG